MINATEEYRAAIVGTSRRTHLKAVVDISDPDMAFSGVESSGAADFSQPAQLYDRVMDLTPYATLEPHRWVLNGKFRLIPAEGVADQVGFVGDVLSGADGIFPKAVWVEEQFSNLSILQACSVYFPGDDWDGVPDTFTIEVKQGGTAYYSKEFTGNRTRTVSLSGFTVNNPDAIQVTVSKWSLSGRRMRVAEILPGVYEEWTEKMLVEFNATQQTDFSCITLPYGTMSLSLNNIDKRFEPRKKDGLFASIEDRQGIETLIGVELPSSGVEYKKVGVYYQYGDGWKTSNNDMSIDWSLVDIVGLVAERTYLPPTTLPTTLEGWISSVVSQLGDNFKSRYHVDPDYAKKSVKAKDKSAVTGKKCGDILRWACMVTGTFPRADAETGYLTAEPLWNQGNKTLLTALATYPTMKANKSVASLIFTLADGSQYVVSGNSTSSEKTINIENPFIHTSVEALTAARLILSCYGGNLIETTGRGDPSGEIGDVDTIWLDESQATTARRMMQTFKIQDGALQGCQSRLLQADGSFLFQARAVITKNGSWTAPAGVTALRLILVGKGEDGTAGTDGTWDEAGADGVDGIGGLVWAGTVSINPQQSFSVQIGDNSVFGQYSSANGSRFPFGYTDIASGDSFARTGVQKPVPGSGDGGAKGLGGIKGNRHKEPSYDSEGNPVGSHWEIDNYPGEGTAGQAGVSGCVVIYWDKEGA
jgi:hypothetical protein|nr:MAG TPA: hypothetical protein [Caudoviricetes sp.]